MIRIFSGLFNYRDRASDESLEALAEKLEELEIAVSKLEQKIDSLRDPEYNLRNYTLGK